MAQSFVTTQGTLIIPGAYPSISVLTQPSGLATSGVVMLVGEADQGPDYSLEADLSLNAFGPDQAAAVVTKYKSGPLVDAFLAGAAPANDPEITQSPSLFVLVKTNASARASANLPKWGGGTYAVLADKGFGKLGNLIYYTISTNTPEVAPSATFAFIPPTGTVSLDVRVIGAGTLQGAAQPFNAIAANTTPAGFVTALAAINGASVSGGTDRAVITAVAGNIAVTSVAGNTATFITSGTWGTTPSVGDTVFVSATSVIKGTANANAGGWIVVAATNNTITATKLADTSGGLLTAVTPPVAVGSVAIASTSADLQAFAPVTISVATTNPVDGIGKSLEIASTANGAATDIFARCAAKIVLGAAQYANTVSVTAPAWVSNTSYATGDLALANGFVWRCVSAGLSASAASTGPSGASYNITVTDNLAGWQLLGSPLAVVGSASEYQPLLQVSRQADNTSELLAAGGEIALRIGYKGTSATISITPTTLSTVVTGGAGAALNIVLSQYATINDLAQFINSQPGYSCAAGSALGGQFSPLALDEVTGAQIGNTNGALTGRIKKDAVAFANKLGTSSTTVRLGTGTTSTIPAIGVPAPQATPIYLSGGSKGGTSNAQVVGAIDALQRVRGNFLIPLFSRDALADATDTNGATTESTSTYTIDSINAYAKSHVILMSTLKRRRNRQAFLSKRDTFLNAQGAASNIANFRCSFYFQDVKTINSQGSLVQQQPWMAAVIAASMQAAGFYKAIVNKGLNVSGALQAATTPADFSDQDMTQVESALLAGLNPIERAETGGFRWVSDQTTYGVDNNFVFNSIQAVYVADVIALTCAKRMQDKFKGKSVADISAAMAMSFMQGIMSDFLRLKLIAPSDDAPGGFKNLKVQISGPALVVQCEVKLAGAIYYIPISFLVSAVQQTATS